MSDCDTSDTWVTLKSDAMRVSHGRISGFIPECGEFGKIYGSTQKAGSTSHDQCACLVLAIESEWVILKYDGFQCRQVYSITHITINHSQTQHENNYWMHPRQRRVIWEKACLVITHSKWEYSSTLTKHIGNCNYPFQSLPTHSHSQSHTQNNQRRTGHIQ